MSLTPRALVAQSPQVAFRAIAGRTVLLKAPLSSLHTLNKVGEFIWGLIAAPRPISEVCDEVGRRFEVEPDQAERDVLEFLAKLEAQGLITVRDE